MEKQEEKFEHAKMTLNNLKETLGFSELQFDRIKSTIQKSAIWDENIEKAILDFMDELDEKDRKEAKFRYETAKAASSSAKALWEQLNRCAETELAKDDVLLILNHFISYFEEVAAIMNNNNDTEVLLHFRKIFLEIKQM